MTKPSDIKECKNCGEAIYIGFQKNEFSLTSTSIPYPYTSPLGQTGWMHVGTDKTACPSKIAEPKDV